MSIKSPSAPNTEPRLPPFVNHAVTLWVAGMVGVVAVMPYVMQLMPDELETAGNELGVSTGSLVAISIAQSAVLLAVAVCAGVSAARRLGLRAPISEAILNRQAIAPVAERFLLFSVTIGAAGGVLLLVLDHVVFLPLIPDWNADQVSQPAIWKGALASLYGGIAEELLCRLFLLSVIALCLRRMSRTSERLPIWVFWTANLLVALIFGLGHLPAAASILPLTPIWIARVLLANGVFAVVLGYLFWKRGLEAAMLAHWTGDIVLHVIAPLLFAAR